METRRQFTQEDYQLLIQMWNGGSTKKAIALALDRSFDTIKAAVKRLRKKGVLQSRYELAEVTHGDIRGLSDEYNLPLEVVEWAMSGVKPTVGTHALMAYTRSVLALWTAQGGACYYSGAPLTLTGEPTRRPVLLKTEGRGRILVSRAMAQFRGKLSHQVFVRLCALTVGTMCKHK